MKPDPKQNESDLNEAFAERVPFIKYRRTPHGRLDEVSSYLTKEHLKSLADDSSRRPALGLCLPPLGYLKLPRSTNGNSGVGNITLQGQR
jgi:hypothetical protein